jgi:hypothetical protein
MNTLEGGRKNYQVVAGSGIQFIDLHRAAIYGFEAIGNKASLHSMAVDCRLFDL